MSANRPRPSLCVCRPMLIFPDLASGNIGYKLLQRLARAESLGPMLMGMRQPVNVLLHGVTVSEIAAVTAVTAVQAEAAQATVGRAATPHETLVGRR